MIESLSEDYFTGIGLSAQGYELVYLDEKLSAGLAAESISTYINQRLRWVRGLTQYSPLPSTTVGVIFRNSLRSPVEELILSLINETKFFSQILPISPKSAIV